MKNIYQNKPATRRFATRSIIRVFWTHIYRYPYVMVALILSNIAVQSLIVVIPWFFKLFFDTISLPSIPPAVALDTLERILFLILGLSLLRWLLQRIVASSNIYLQANVMRDLSVTAFENLLGHSYRFFTNNFTGSLVRRINRLSRAFEEVTDQIIGNLIPLSIISVGILVVLFRRNTVLGEILLLWIIFFVVTYYFIALWKAKYDRARSEKDSEATGVLSDALTNVITIKLFSNYAHERSLYQKTVDELKKLRFLGWGIGEGMDATQGMLMIGIEIGILFTSVRLWARGLLTIGDIVLIQTFLSLLMGRIWEFGRVIRRVYEAFADATEMVEILETPYEVKNITGAQPLVVTKGEIEFREVTFGFPERKKIFDDFTLAIRSGEKIALVGSSGAGKSTIIALMLRFHDLQRGEILIDGQNISHVTQESLRKSIALVPQDPILFHRTLLENIRYGRLNATDEEVISAAKLAHCHEFISRLPHRYDTFVGERGVKLSGGERQRVAIARAILAETPILILDEATSSLDSGVESLIQDAMQNLMAQKTSLVIAHRLSTIRQMNRIVVIDNGKIVETGTHEELLGQEGIYARLWKLQGEHFFNEE